MHITLDKVKKHLNVDDWYKDDDDYIMSLVEVAEAAAAKHLQRPMSFYEDADGNLPPALEQACLLLIGHFYNNREAVNFSSLTEVPLAFNYLMDLYAHYNKYICSY